MKSKKSKKDIAEFWKWFSSINELLENNIDNNELLSTLDEKISELNPMFSWEIGPGAIADWCLTISPNLDAKLLKETEEVICLAPNISQWEFSSTRQKKSWDGFFKMEKSDGTTISLDSRNWKYVLLKYPNGECEILLTSERATELNSDDRWTAAAIVLEGMLGERLIMEKIESFNLYENLEPRLALQAKPLEQLARNVLVF
jgi:hypothetical protein